ncbi:hypothetical protein [Marisediminicola sp. LYQ85]|uniref:hypothetical protein n=1 Tax=Marisediminicola sp. LYQ85 TaxID=3391062 RepID=UPI003982F0B8
MSDDLSRRLTAAVREVPGVVDVFAARTPLAVVVDAVTTDAPGPPGLIDVARAPGSVTLTAHVATDILTPAPAVLAAVAAELGRLASLVHPNRDEVVIVVSARVIEAR